MTESELKKAFPNIHPDVLAVNPYTREARGGSTAILAQLQGTFHEQDIRTEGSGKTPKLERPVGNGALGEDQGQKGGAGKLHIRIESVRKRLLDPDNISEKYAIDCLRYAGVLRGDEPDKITLETTQRKCEKGEEEHTLIQIFEP